MTDADWPMVQAGFAHSYLDCHAPAKWAWKFRTDQPNAWRGWVAHNPAAGVVAFLAATVHPMQIGTEQLNMLMPSDNYSHPDWRNGGKRSPYVQVEKAFHAHQKGFAALCLGFGLDRRVRLALLSDTNNRLYEGGEWLRVPIPAQTYPHGCSIQLTLTDFAHPEWNDLWQTRSQQVPWSLVRNQAFLAWRFDARQGHRYQRFAIRSATSAAPLGYWVLRVTGPAEAILVDCMLPTSPQQRQDTWGYLCAWLRQQGIEQLTTFLAAACPEHNALKRLGWATCEAPLPVLPAFTLYSPQHSPDDMNRLYALTLADTDLY